jgi:NAD(P)-dependent dehydrogenase (short-subunit alcohol dehydrogenase family)
MARYPLQGRTLFITGGASGIGAETARQAAKRGANLALVDVDLDGAERIASTLPSAIAIEADVRDYDALTAAASRAAEAFGGIDVAFANAGVEVDGTARGASLEDIERLADINFTGVMRTLKATLPHVIERRGYVLITASLAAAVHTPPLSHYAATKAGVEAFGNAVRIEVAHKGVAVGVAYFAIIGTPMVDRAMAEPIIAEYEAKYGDNAFGKIHPVSGAGAAVIRGMERRARRVTYPRWVRASLLLKPALPRLMEAGLRQRDVSGMVDQMDERDLARQQERQPV